MADDRTVKIFAPTAENIREAGHALVRGDLVAMPTETVYGLAASAFDDAAVARIFATKERPTFDPLIVHVAPEAGSRISTLAQLEQAGLVDASMLSCESRAAVEKLARAFWPGPLTLVLPKTERVPLLVTSGLSTVGVRMPAHPVAQALIQAAERPLAAPSANRFGRISPTTAQAVLEELGERGEGRLRIIDGGACRVGVESTILAFGPDGGPRLLRPGGVAREALEACLGRVIQTGIAEPGSAMPAPGMTASHYAPSKRLNILPSQLAQLDPANARVAMGMPPVGPIGLLVLQGNAANAARLMKRLSGRAVIAESLSASGDFAEMARNLFAALRRLDASDAEALFAEPCPDQGGISHAIADRLARAAAPRA